MPMCPLGGAYTYAVVLRHKIVWPEVASGVATRPRGRKHFPKQVFIYFRAIAPFGPISASDFNFFASRRDRPSPPNRWRSSLPDWNPNRLMSGSVCVWCLATLDHPSIHIWHTCVDARMLQKPPLNLLMQRVTFDCICAKSCEFDIFNSGIWVGAVAVESNGRLRCIVTWRLTFDV